ncbi:hypothetical protein NAV11_20035 [Pseudomonas songnenensis]|uniref:Uncharacterized protein n=1 Tax=Pseudomonas songnenensis TaxID=1176259 RepID=A0ABX9UQN9_9PSED|nr:hypothetical protein [Pseudomonas songnenensis]MCQ4302211.1 hypothetical protein [Pseudomonas songnenensis]RMH95439.1 hypothetical protein EA798_16760 [Pseudomonas songnenensis]
MTEQEEFEFRLRLEQEQAAAPVSAVPVPAVDAAAPQAQKPGMLDGMSPLAAVSGLGPIALALGIPTNAQQISDVTGGLIRGAGSIGATAMRILPNALGGDTAEENAARRAAMDAGLSDLGAKPDSFGYKGGKLAGEIAGTAGAGSMLAGGARVAGATPSIISALQTGGINAAGKTGITGLATRAVGGAATGGLAAGMVNPEEAGTGALIGGGLPLVMKGVAHTSRAASGGVKSLVEPLYERGREKIISRALREFSGDQVDDAIRNLQSARELVPGSKPTVGEAAQVPSLAALQRSTFSGSSDAANALHGRFAENNQARIEALETLAGSPAARRAAEEAREQAAAAAYGSARAQAAGGIKPSQELMELAERPAMKKFIASAKRLAADKGQKIDNPLESIDGLHYVKLAVDDALAGSPSNALARNQKAAVMDIKDRLIAEMDKVSPAYGESRRAYQEASKPINQMDIGDELKNVIDPLTGRIRASQFARKLSDDTARQATGFKQATLAGTLTPEQLASLNAIKDDLARAEFAQTAGRGVGSNTAQNLAYNNMMNQLGIPTFLRNFAGGEVLGNLGARAGDVVYGKANQEIAGLLANTMLDPAEAARLMLLRDTANPALLEAGRKGLLGVSKAAPVIGAD